MSAILRKGSIIAIAILACAAGGLMNARAEVPMRAPGAAPSLHLAQSNAAWCRNSAARIQSWRSHYRSSCSGRMSRLQYERCRQMGREINDAIARHNANCR